MKKYRYTIEFITDAPISERDQNKLASALHQLITEAAAESGETVYASVGSENPVDVSETELAQFKKDAGYDP